MKRSLLIVIILILSCAGSLVCWASSNEGVVQVDLQKGFKHNSIKIYFNGNLKYKKTDATTNPVLDLACGTTLKIFPDEKNHIKVTVDGKIAFEQDVPFSKYVAFGITKDRYGNYSVERSGHPFLYD